MDSRKNPYAPGAGNPPPDLAGRDAIIESSAIAHDRISATLIAIGMVYSLSHGDNAFTVPLFDEFMKRVMPELEK